MYCGNNANNRRVTRGELVIGDRYGCLKKGIGQGLYMVYDNSYLDEYVPIVNTRVYCGQNVNLPEGYDRFGGLHECLIKGVGVGRRQKAVKIDRKIRNQSISRIELIELCRELNISGYSRLTRNDIFDLILNHLTN
jgi:hypothetical protein